ncbi:RpiB/LacA/LacB family sugar-phosphate isomerase [Spiroplasma endosymbiont of Aspidapion aeneum]|uniref:RpiB/LacA/LacB family sugar-phosphate isomerase n=1 Tax=Spiroplasma endosymbiont of Aspidapion aeneum TaxID=3066276 RepID=UPI00313C7B51
MDIKSKTIYISTNNFLTTIKKIGEVLKKENLNVVDINQGKKLDIYDASVMVAEKVSNDPEKNVGIIIDEYGNGGFMVAAKFKGTIVAQLGDEHSAHMTRGHNNTNIITLGADLTAEKQIIKIIKRFLFAKFEGGRHMVRIDMLEEMLKGDK